MKEQSGKYDCRGIPIHYGDMIRVKHYRHRRRKEQMWIYLIVGEYGGVPVVYNWEAIDRGSRYQCLLCAISDCEIVAENGMTEIDGRFFTFNERPRKDQDQPC